MDTRLVPLVFAASLVLAACGRETPAPASQAGEATGLLPWNLPAPPGSMAPDLVVGPRGRVALSWLNVESGRRTLLQYAELGVQDRWEGPLTIAVGNSFMANAVDTPHIAIADDHALWVQYLQRQPEGGYGVRLTTSRSGGMNWSDPIAVNDDSVAAEHGFAALWPAGSDRIGIAWLDGRDAGGEGEGHDDGHAHAGATALRAATFGPDLQRAGETVVDARSCDCCSTAVARTPDGVVLAYRDRDENEIRDIATVAFDGKRWSAPRLVHADGWHMEGCPVNGPSIAADGDDVVLGWFTAANDEPRVQLARSEDGGAHFGAPLVLERGKQVDGRVAVALDGDNAWALWLREEFGGASLWLARLAPDLSRERERVKVATLKAHGIAAGYPRLVLRDGTAYIVWTDSDGTLTQLQGARFVPKQ
ncbi:MAG: sialidase family protein [Lysobacterales bacterium]